MCNLTELVRQAWQNACQNGYGETLRAMAPDEVAVDMISYDADIEALIGRDMPSLLLEQRIVAVLPQIMRECVDEGCPHYGTPHECRTVQ